MEKYFEILKEIEDNRIDMTKLYILSCIENFKPTKSLCYSLNNAIFEVMEYIYDTWLEIDEDICLAKLCDIVCEHWEEILDEIYDIDDITTDLFI